MSMHNIDQAQLVEVASGPSSAIKHSAAIQIENSITLLQRRTWNVLLAHAYDALVEREVHTIKVRDLMATIGFESKNERYLKDALKTLAGCTVEWNILGKDGSQRWGVTALLAQAEIENGVCTYAYSPILRSRLHNPNMYAKISLAIQRRFSSKHALALYELCLDYLFEARNSGETPFILIDDYRRLMGLDEDSYPDFKRLNQRVIKEPLAEINKVTDLTVKVEYRKQGRRVVAVKFRIRNAVKISEPDGSTPQILAKPVDESNPIVRELINMGMDKGTALDVYRSGFDGVVLTQRPGHEDFDRYVQEKITLCAQKREVGGLRNPVGFLLEAIRENYANPDAVERVRGVARRKIAADLTALERERSEIEVAHDSAQHEICARIVLEHPTLLRDILREIKQDRKFYRVSIDLRKDDLDNYRNIPPLTGAVDHCLREMLPEEFARVDETFTAQLNTVDEKIAALKKLR